VNKETKVSDTKIDNTRATRPTDADVEALARRMYVDLFRREGLTERDFVTDLPDANDCRRLARIALNVPAPTVAAAIAEQAANPKPGVRAEAEPSLPEWAVTAGVEVYERGGEWRVYCNAKDERWLVGRSMEWVDYGSADISNIFPTRAAAIRRVIELGAQPWMRGQEPSRQGTLDNSPGGTHASAEYAALSGQIKALQESVDIHYKCLRNHAERIDYIDAKTDTPRPPSRGKVTKKPQPPTRRTNRGAK
jgi:hypothetical protein